MPPPAAAASGSTRISCWRRATPRVLQPDALTLCPSCVAPQERRIRERVEALEADTGIKLRVLAQNYPQVGAALLLCVLVSFRRLASLQMLRVVAQYHPQVWFRAGGSCMWL